MDKKINQEFLREISKIQDIALFLGVMKLLGVKEEKEDKTQKEFSEVLDEVMKKFESKARSKRKELVKILRKANKAAEADFKGKTVAPEREEDSENGKN